MNMTKEAISVGLGFIALGLLLYEGVHFNINGITMFPAYIGLSILLIGLLSVRKRVKITHLDISFILGFLLLIFNVADFNNYVLDILYDIVHVVFVIVMLWGIMKLANDEHFTYKIIKYYILIFLTYVALWFSPHLITRPEFMIKWNTFLMLLIEFYVVMICYRIYQKNNELKDEYNEDRPEKYIKGNFKPIAILGMIVCIGIITLLEEPFVHSLTQADTDKYEFHGYGEIKDKVIIDHFWEDNYFAYRYDLIHVWLNNEDYNKTETYSIYTIVDGVENEYCRNEYITKYDPEIHSNEAHIVNVGTYDGYSWLNFRLAEDKIEYSEIYDDLSELTIQIYLFDENGEMFREFNVPVVDRYEKAKTYYYEDEIIKVDNLKIDGDIIVRTPEIHINKLFDDVCFTYLSGSPDYNKELDRQNYYNRGIWLDSLSISREKLEAQLDHLYTCGHIIYKYLPEKETYYLHITDENQNLIKTLELKEK